MSWSDLPNELLNDIIQHLEVADVIRSEAVCAEWRSGICREYYRKSNVPWLMLSSCDDDKINFRYFYSLVEHKVYKICLPDIAGQHCVGSSHGYLVSVDDNADLIATNPLAGGTHVPLPPTSALPDVASVIRDDSGRIIEYEVNKFNWVDPSVSQIRDLKDIQDRHYRKVVLTPDAGIVVAIHGGEDGWLAFSCVGDQSWTCLGTPTTREFDDTIFHKSRLYAIDYMGTIAIFNLDCPLDPLLVSQEGPLRGMDGQPRRYLIKSPDGNKFFLLLKIFDYDDHTSRTKSFTVYLLDETTYTLNQIMDLGEIAIFIGFNYSMSLCTHGCTGIKRNSIYFTDDDKDHYLCCPEAVGDTGVFNLEDGSIERVFSDKELDQLNWPPPTWFMPTLSCVS